MTTASVISEDPAMSWCLSREPPAVAQRQLGLAKPPRPHKRDKVVTDDDDGVDNDDDI